jgi:hypothetical protein
VTTAIQKAPKETDPQLFQQPHLAANKTLAPVSSSDPYLKYHMQVMEAMMNC